MSARLFNNAKSRSMSSTSTHRTLLLTFDAFDTLFHPREPVPDQYASTAHEFGLSRTAITPQKLKAAFKTTFREQASRYPNYGRADVLHGRYGGPKQWWEEVIRGSFKRTLSEGDASRGSIARDAHASNMDTDPELPAGLVEALIDLFAGARGYTLYDDVAPFFARMRELKAAPRQNRFDQVIVGVVSNSDDRVPAVLKALGLRVGDLRADQDISSGELPGFEQRKVRDSNTVSGQIPSDLDLDFVITSYEAGEEKPNRLIFDVAERQARLLVPGVHVGSGSWTRVHVGDDYRKDYQGAIEAGWQSYLLHRGDGEEGDAKSIPSLMDLINEVEID
jgi:FMN phosphatase YigB (HAD superfamily)